MKHKDREKFNARKLKKYIFFITVKPNVSCTGLAARNWMIHMNPMAKSIESNQSSQGKDGSRKASKSSTPTAAALAALALGGVSRRSKKRSTKRRASSSSYPSM